MRYRQFLKYRLLAFAFFLTMCGIAGSSFAQGNSDRSEQGADRSEQGSRQVQVYDCIAVAKMDNVIFRGELAEKYQYTINGTAYAYSDEFKQGDIVFNGKLYMGVFLNLNSHRDELQLKASESGIKASGAENKIKDVGAEAGFGAMDDGINIALKRELVGDFSIGERNYTSLYGENAVKGLKEGYYEVLYRRDSSTGGESSIGRESSTGGESSGCMLVKRHYKNVTEKMNSITGKIETTFNSKHKYYLVADGYVRSVKNEKNLAKICRAKKSELKEFLKLNKGKGSEELMRGVMLIVEK